MAADSSELLTVAEACRYLKVTRTTLYRWARLGKLRFVKLGERSTRLRRDDVARLAGLDGGQRDVSSPGNEEAQGWLKLAESSFAKDWDNEQDAIYDNWKELYGVCDR
jgi:excisionase family DNA binding protein